MGFGKEWNLGPVGKFIGKTVILIPGNALKVIGILWFLACLLLLLSAWTYYFGKDWFWITGLTALITSQALVILYWPEAKWGTIINFFLLIIVIFSAAHTGFKKSVNNDVASLLERSPPIPVVISEEQVATLPDIIQIWLRKSKVMGRAMPQRIHIVQKGSIRTDANSNWMPFDAEQYFTIDPPGFVWHATIHTDKFIDIVARDKYENGKGSMLIKVSSLVTLANSSGEEIDQGTMIRYMAEIIWFPQAAVSDYLEWEQLDTNHARVTMNYNGLMASGVYTFNNGLPTSFEAERFGEFNGKYSKETWHVSTTGYNYFNGVPVGNKNEVTWKLKEGDFTWLKLELTELK